MLQLLTGLPLCFVYLIFDAGLIEEFFFRGLLQSRLSVLLKSSIAGIVSTAVILGWCMHRDYFSWRRKRRDGRTNAIFILGSLYNC